MRAQINDESTEAKLNNKGYSLEASVKDHKNQLYFFVKRLMDIIGAIIGILFTLPLIVVFSVIYQIGENKGPMIFKQERIGKHGKIFYVYKFRSMVSDAEQKLKENKSLYQKYLKNNYKLEPNEDPRITKFGRFIRKTSLDELPQFLNVLKGEMSLVGPRPVVMEELKEYKDKKREFLSVKPGITGYWQAGGRSEVGYPERVDIELYYIFHKSTLLDMKIIMKTVAQIIYRKGAY